ncbi:hypothetical protein BCR32DRAFT_31700 [Anaeromyces robustus]|uniref:COPI associated n=1 Tax=Anaeromyces robustus TaxID=1754192 RepID=A0A1Y1XM02_9FUNG|nr:hypothetical protein BCR32DRAFT_31700 [Anaeromyces robustus]|eukprot:ORX86725.1 hypothetical protein BCR32DRAFT_31700 [Anaeromyces robustus]
MMFTIKKDMDKNIKILYYFSLVSAVLMAIEGIIYILINPFSFNGFIIGIVTIFISFVLCLTQISNENKIQNIIKKYCPFLFTYIGRGAILVFFGCIILTTHLILIIFSSTIIFVGILFILLHFISKNHYEEEKEIFGWAPNFSEEVV